MFLGKPYYLVPEKNGVKGYFLLTEAMKKRKKVAIAKIVIRTKQHLAMSMVKGDYLVLEIMRFAHEVMGGFLKVNMAVASVMLPFINQRPISLVRCTQNNGKKCFYQRHPGNSSVLRNLKCFAVKNKADHKLYFTLDSARDSSRQLRELVQMDVIEIHTWNCHYQTPGNQDQIIIDFDPALDVSFKEVVKACLQMKKMLDKLKLWHRKWFQ